MSDEYPKVICVGGVTVTVQHAADEARWRTPPTLSDVVESPEPMGDTADPLSDVSVEPDTPAVSPHATPTKKKTTTAAKKK